MTNRYRVKGFTLVEMVIAIVITGIVAGMVAVFLTQPVKQYTDLARRAELTDVADTALRRIARDLRLALPNSVRVTGACDGTAGTCFIEFLPTGSASCADQANCAGGGRYRAGSGGDVLDFGAADTTFQVLGPMPPLAAGDQIVVYNLGIAGADAYEGNTAGSHVRRAVTAVDTSTATVTIASGNALPFDSPGHRFHVVTTPVTYVCAPSSTGGTLTRVWGYPIAATQPSALPIADSSSAVLAKNVTQCRFEYTQNVVAQRSGLITMRLGLTQDRETVTLYSATHVSNQP